MTVAELPDTQKKSQSITLFLSPNFFKIFIGSHVFNNQKIYLRLVKYVIIYGHDEKGKRGKVPPQIISPVATIHNIISNVIKLNHT